MSKKKAVDLETVAGHFQSLVSIIMSTVKAGYVPYEVVRWLTTDVGSCTLRGLLVKARNEYVEINGIKPNGPVDVLLDDGKKVRALLAQPPEWLGAAAESFVEFAKSLQIQTCPYGFVPASKLDALAFVRGKTCDMYLIEWGNEVWLFRRLIVIEGQAVVDEVVKERLCEAVPVLLVANQIPAFRDDDPCGD